MALNPKQFGTVMKNARMDKKLTQAELAEILDLSLSYLKDLERFKNTPSLEVFAKTIQYFNLSADTCSNRSKRISWCLYGEWIWQFMCAFCLPGFSNTGFLFV